MALSTNTYGYLVDPMFAFTDASGKPLVGGYLKICQAGTTTAVLTHNNWDNEESYNEEKIPLDISGHTFGYVIAPKGSAYKILVCDESHDENDPVRTIDKKVSEGASVNTSGDIVQGLNSASASSLFFNATVSDNTLNLQDKQRTAATEEELTSSNNLLLQVGNALKSLPADKVAKESEASELRTNVGTCSTNIANTDARLTAEITRAKAEEAKMATKEGLEGVKTELESDIATKSKKADVAPTKSTDDVETGDVFYDSADGALKKCVSATSSFDGDSGESTVIVGATTIAAELKGKATKADITAPTDKAYGRKGNEWVEVQGGGGGSTSWDNITGKPETFPPSSHTHEMADVNGLQSAINAKADYNATNEALNGKANVSHTHAMADVSGLETALGNKANSADVYAKTEVYDKDEVDGKVGALNSAIGNEASARAALASATAENFQGINATINTKANSEDVYSKNEIDTMIGDVETLLAAL